MRRDKIPDQIMMASKRYRVLRLLKKTQASGFKNIEAGDIIQFSVPLIKDHYSSSRDFVKTTILTKNNISMEKTINQIQVVLESFELEEIHEEDLNI